MVETYRAWFDSWRRSHIVLLVAGSVAATDGMVMLGDDGGWVLLPVVCLGVLTLFTPLGHPPRRRPTVERRPPTAAQRDAERRRKDE